MDIKGLSFIILVCTIIGVTNAGNFLILGDWGGIPIRPYTTDIEESTANQMSVTATQKNSKFVIALGTLFFIKNHEILARFFFICSISSLNLCISSYFKLDFKDIDFDPCFFLYFLNFGKRYAVKTPLIFCSF